MGFHLEERSPFFVEAGTDSPHRRVKTEAAPVGCAHSLPDRRGRRLTYVEKGNRLPGPAFAVIVGDPGVEILCFADRPVWAEAFEFRSVILCVPAPTFRLARMLRFR